MVTIRFNDPATEKKALGFLAGRFSFTTKASGETLVPEVALAALAGQGLTFTVEGRADYRQRVSAIRGSAPATV